MPLADPPLQRPDFDAALAHHLAAIANRDLAAFKASVTAGPVLYTIVQNGHAFTTPAETIALHKEWFARSGWIWEGEVVHKIEGADMATVVMRYAYRDKPDDAPMTTWLTLVFRIEDGAWRLVHDHNTMIQTPVKAN